jgi:hypothetical protein
MEAGIVLRARRGGSEYGLPVLLTEFALEGWVDWPAHAKAFGRVPGFVLEFFSVLNGDV